MSSRIATAVIVLLVFTVGVQAYAQRKPGSYTVYGVGSHSCGRWAQDVNDTPLGYIKAAWVQGFVTAAGAYGGNLRETDAAAVRGFISLYCSQNPLKDIDDASYALVLELRKPQ